MLPRSRSLLTLALLAAAVFIVPAGARADAPTPGDGADLAASDPDPAASDPASDPAAAPDPAALVAAQQPQGSGSRGLSYELGVGYLDTNLRPTDDRGASGRAVGDVLEGGYALHLYVGGHFTSVDEPELHQPGASFARLRLGLAYTYTEQALWRSRGEAHSHRFLFMPQGEFVLGGRLSIGVGLGFGGGFLHAAPLAVELGDPLIGLGLYRVRAGVGVRVAPHALIGVDFVGDAEMTVIDDAVAQGVQDIVGLTGMVVARVAIDL